MQTSDQNNNTNFDTARKAEKTTSRLVLAVIIAVLLFLAAITAVFVSRNLVKGTKTIDEAIEQYMSQLPVLTSEGGCLSIDSEPSTEEGRKLYDICKGLWKYEVVNVQQDGGNAVASINISCPDIGVFKQSVRVKVSEELNSMVTLAKTSKEIYNDDLTFRDNVLNTAYEKAFNAASVEIPIITLNANLLLKREFFKWSVTSQVTINNSLDAKAQEIKKSATENHEYISKKYTIQEGANAGPKPQRDNFVETNDPNVIKELLNTPYAKNLLKGQTLLWNENLPFLEGTTISCYLDETILMIQWQENEQHMVGTFSEIIVADGSQIRKKIAGDTFGDMHFETTSSFCTLTNAVLAVGGDFYNHARNCGIVVQDRKAYRYDLSSCDVAYFNSNGEMIFSYRNQFSNEAEADAFIKDNDVLYSLSFGPVLIDNGVDKCPNEYPWGQINDTYARSAIGTLGDRHYLTMNMNCGPNGATYGYATLRMAADCMIKRGCINAYTLDGGQTATTAVNGVLKNPVQFGVEKAISDVIYFVSAIPEES